ncbi:unnamed protein product, partial [Mesorhabditis belari]|uniref:Uncharacterized protein n=1 Tax=Mesorhabditis belari TaxID=2138241 RepID=A0AAF3J8Q3_9BILA
MAQLKTYGEKFRDADAEIEELTTKMRALEKYKRLFEEKEDELQNLIAENTSDRRARQLDAEKKEQQYLEDFRQQEEAMRDLKEKLDSSEQLHIEQMQLMEMERKKEREARDSLQEQIKKLEAFNMQLKQMKDNIKEGETLETARLIDENTALRRQVTDLQEREHILQTHLFDHQHLIGELRKEILALEEQCQKFETWNPSRNTIAQPHLKESYFLETNSPNSEAILRGNAMVKHEPITPKHH